MTTFASRLRAARMRAGLTQRELSARAGLGLAAVARYERLVREPTMSSVQRLCRELGVTPNDLIPPIGGGTWS